MAEMHEYLRPFPQNCGGAVVLSSSFRSLGWGGVGGESRAMALLSRCLLTQETSLLSSFPRGPVALRKVRANQWLTSIENYTFVR